MSIEDLTKISIEEYLTNEGISPIYKMKVCPQFSPLDMNLQFIIEEGWSQADRVRFHLEREIKVEKDHPLAFLLNRLKPHLLIRRFDREKGSFIAISITVNGEMDILSNDIEYAKKYLNGLFLNCPPSYHSVEELDLIGEKWVVDKKTSCYVSGLASRSVRMGSIISGSSSDSTISRRSR